MSVDGLRCILYARIYIPCMRTIYTITYKLVDLQFPVPISSELKFKKLLIGPVFIQPTFVGINRMSLYHIIRKLFQTLTTR